MGYHDAYAATWQKVFSQLGWKPTDQRTAIEVGSYAGSSASWIAHNLLRGAGSRLFCIDPWPGMAEQRASFFRNLKTFPDPSIVTVLEEYSRPALIRLASEGVEADLVYIDGSHKASDVLSDLVISFGLLKVGGILICDDYLWADPRHDGGNILNRPKMAIDAFTTIYAEKFTWAMNVPNWQTILLKRAD